jgi:hypothetical protein
MSTKLGAFCIYNSYGNRQSYSYASATCAKTGGFPFKPPGGRQRNNPMKNEVERVLDVYKELGVKTDVGYIYILKAENGLYKIGKSKNPGSRINSIRTSSPVKLEVYKVFLSSEYNRQEKHLHRMFANLRELGEWFRLTDEELETINETQGDHTLLPCYL